MDHEDTIFPNLDMVDPVQGVKYAKGFKYEPGDIMMCSYPKTGTHWMGNMMWKLKTLDISKRPVDTILEFGPPEAYQNLERPRFFGTHMKPNRLPIEHIQNKGKIVLILRNPKDAMVSYYHHLKNAVLFKSKQSWDEFFQSYIDGKIMMGSYFDYVQQWEEFLKDKPNDHHVEVFYYEDLKGNLNYSLSRLNHYMGFNRDEKYIEQVKEETTLSALREQDSPGKRGTHPTVQDENGDSVIYRKGIVGDWKNYLTVAQSETVDKLMKARLKHGIINIKYDI